MEEWRVTTSSGVNVFDSLSDAIAWISQQTEAPMTLHRCTVAHWGAFGVPGGKRWPDQQTAAFAASVVNHTKMKRR